MNSDHHKVISTGSDPELLWLRDAVLQSAGFDVMTTANEDDALNRIRQGNCGILLLCYSLSERARENLAEEFRKFCPNGRIVAIANEKMDKPEVADALVYGVEGPEALIDVIRAA
jgi:DNA-binding NarL/FixJ family response regulator